MSWLVWLGAVLGVCAAGWQLTRQRYGGPGRCSFCTRRAIGSVQKFRPGCAGRLWSYCERHVALATRKAGR